MELSIGQLLSGLVCVGSLIMALVAHQKEWSETKQSLHMVAAVGAAAAFRGSERGDPEAWAFAAGIAFFSLIPYADEALSSRKKREP